jgi:hypothetical protein
MRTKNDGTQYQIKIMKNMKKSITVIILIIVSLVLNAQNDKQREYSILTALIDNNWTGNGVLMGKEATFTMDWDRVLDNNFIKLEFQNTRKSVNNEDIIFRATAFYKIVNDTIVVGNWFDNRGITFPLKGSIKEDELTILWGNDGTENGKTIYHYIMDSNKITVEDFIMNNGKYSKFGSATYDTKDL